MSLKSQIRQRRFRRRGPMGSACALLVGCVVTLIGVAHGMEPYVILYRAVISGCLFGMVVWFGLNVISLANSQP